MSKAWSTRVSRYGKSGLRELFAGFAESAGVKEVRVAAKQFTVAEVRCALGVSCRIWLRCCPGCYCHRRSLYGGE